MPSPPGRGPARTARRGEGAHAPPLTPTPLPEGEGRGPHPQPLALWERGTAWLAYTAGPASLTVAGAGRGVAVGGAAGVRARSARRTRSAMGGASRVAGGAARFITCPSARLTRASTVAAASTRSR